MEEDPMHFFIHLFQSDLFVAQHFANEDAALMPTDVSAVVHPPRLERFWIFEVRYPTGEQPSARHVYVPRCLVGKRLMWAFMVKDVTKAIELLLLRCHCACRRLRCLLL